MPTYTYQCENESCEIYNLEFEVQQSMKDDKLVKCPECGMNSLFKVITPSGGFRIGGIGVHKPTTHWGS